MEKLYDKLVRDNIPNIIKNNGGEPIYRELEQDEYWDYLLKKDEEELLEVKEAKSLSDRKMTRDPAYRISDPAPHSSSGSSSCLSVL